jgi:hypothetical protein
MQVEYGDNCVDMSIVRHWHMDAKDGEAGKVWFV